MASPSKSFYTRMGRSTLWNAQKGKCCSCGKSLGRLDYFLNGQIIRDTVTIDHVHAKKRMPNRSRVKQLIGNAMLAHKSCNNKKGHREPTGCELIMLYIVNRKCMLPTNVTAKYDTPWKE